MTANRGGSSGDRDALTWLGLGHGQGGIGLGLDSVPMLLQRGLFQQLSLDLRRGALLTLARFIAGETEHRPRPRPRLLDQLGWAGHDDESGPKSVGHERTERWSVTVGSKLDSNERDDPASHRTPSTEKTMRKRARVAPLQDVRIAWTRRSDGQRGRVRVKNKGRTVRPGRDLGEAGGRGAVLAEQQDYFSDGSNCHLASVPK